MNASQSTVDLLRATADRFPGHDAYVDPWCRLTFGEWDEAADALAAVLVDRGVRDHDVVCARLPSSARFAILYQATMRIGAILSGINPRLGSREVGHIVDKSAPRLLVVDERFDAPTHRDSVTYSTLQADVVPGATPPRYRATLETPVAIVWTSGTTGLPKGAVFRHAQLRATAEGMREFLRPHDRQLTPYPLSQIGYATRVWGEIEHVLTNVITPQVWDAGEALRLLEAEAVTIGQGVVTHWIRMLREPSVHERDFSHMRLAVIGGFAFAPELASTISSMFQCPLVNRYGSTEASGITSTRVGDPDAAIARTVGQPSAGVEIECRDASGRVHGLGSRDSGIVWCRSEAIMDGYWLDERETARRTADDGWLCTGDIGVIDADGRLVLKGRSNESYIRGGFTIHPGEIEAVLEEHPSICRAAILPSPDDELGDVTVAFVEPERDAEVTLEESRTWVAGHLAKYKAPDRIIVFDALPKNDLGKIDKKALRLHLDAVTTQLTPTSTGPDDDRA